MKAHAGLVAIHIRLLVALLALCALTPSSTMAQGGKTEVLWLGQACFRITTPGGKVIVIDPWLQKNPKTPPEYRNLDALGKVDMILVSHGHFDHFDDAVPLAKKHNVPIYGPAGLNQLLLTLGIMPGNLVPRANIGGSVLPLPGIKITMTHTAHSSEFNWKPATPGNEARIGGLPQTGDETLVGGAAVGFVIQLENGFKIYHAGDTGLFGDMRLIGDYYRPDLVLLPIGGNFTMDAADAAFATREYLKPKYAIPMHYGSHPLHTGTPQKYIEALGNAAVKVLALNPGDKVEF
jgi:L-ascorbate metabolism protein UlaG (beta-lactamase superfamily)